MRLSTKGRYGVRAMLDLAIHEAIGPVSIKNISQREGISVNYLEQIFNQLRRAGWVRSIRGPGGGFLLARPSKEITVLDIIKALKVPVVPVFCVDEEQEISQCERVDSCVSRLLWQRLGDKIKEILEGTSLEDLLIEARRISRLPQPEHKHMFQI
ncbi:MAG: RrF2 family transcriptional regulator [bacterium]